MKRGCINHVLPPENFLLTFKCLETKEVMKAREVCRFWGILVDENKALWRIIELSGKGLEEIQSVVEQFDKKSGSTLEEISMIIKRERLQGFSRLAELLQKSEETLQSIRIQILGSDPDSQRLQIFTKLLLSANLIDFRITGDSPSVVKLNFSENPKTNTRYLQILWLPLVWDLPSSHPTLFKTLTSLKVTTAFDDSTCRKLISPSAPSLKHLNIATNSTNDRVSTPPLQLPKLQVLELQDLSHEFPTWMVVSSTLKLYTTTIYSNVPQISELRTSLRVLGKLSTRPPRLDVFRYGSLNELYSIHLLTVLKERRRNVEARMEVEGRQVESIKKLIIPFEGLGEATLNKFRELVGEVVDWSSEPEWEVEI